jgi:SAM-dependent methyltransferase
VTDATERAGLTGVDSTEPGIRRVDVNPDRYDERWRDLAATGADVHGEANLVVALTGPPATGPVLDAGCGTGRVSIELARRGYQTVGVDVDPALVERARAKAPELEWHLGDLAALPATVAPGPFAAAVLAGNVMIFVARGTEAAVLRSVADRLAPGALVIAGFQLGARLSLGEYDAAAAVAGLEARARFATWEGEPFVEGGDYVVAVDSKR